MPCFAASCSVGDRQQESWEHHALGGVADWFGEHHTPVKDWPQIGSGNTTPQGGVFIIELVYNLTPYPLFLLLSDLNQDHYLEAKKSDLI